MLYYEFLNNWRIMITENEENLKIGYKQNLVPSLSEIKIWKQC